MDNNLKHPSFNSTIERSKHIIYASLKDIDKSNAPTHYEIDRSNVTFEYINEIANREIEPDNKYEVINIEGLIISEEDNNSGCVINYCDKDWQVLTDSWFESIEDAKEMVEKQYPGISSKWITKHRDENKLTQKGRITT